ncbi:IPT/TIG domain-containing protein [Tenacibaculum sp. M341]|uniref:IPT/TIG domain-containing protein n=1 Tax=Tenacibaculum sp. M341 TaxID=2530339 RepID=UPI001050A6F4|nr:IPT/TIG domain-containing protein [Tenacibaculum sp. M341]TCI90644.1 hypothetical protein EYW44_13040 [Tenacibaculum sp. M341]
MNANYYYQTITAVCCLIACTIQLNAQKVTSMSPTSGSLYTNTVKFKGSGFSPSNKPTILFGKVGVPSNNITVDSNLITVKTPKVSKPQSVDVTFLFGSKKQKLNTKFTFKLPTITSVSPDSTALIGNKKITIKGKYLSGATTVKFGSASSPASPLNDSIITVKNPTQKSGTVNVRVKVQGKLSKKNEASFTYCLPEIKKISPDSSSVKGNKLITIKGKYLSGVQAINFGTKGGTNINVQSDNVLTVKNPTVSKGQTINVTAISQSQSSKTNVNSTFKYLSNKSDSIYTLSLKNATKLSSNYKIYVLGYSTNSKKMLKVNPTTLKASFEDIKKSSGYIESYELGTEITSIELSNTNPIVGARIYFFVANTSKTYKDNSNKTLNKNLGFSYSNSGASVSQVANPPQQAFPHFSYIEATFKKDKALYIDVSSVDGFFFPLSIIAQDKNGTELDRIGQPANITSKQITASYKPFIENSNAIDAYKDLYQNLDSDITALINPGLYLQKNISELETVFNDALNTIFTSTTLNMNIWQNGTNSFQKNYTVTPVQNQPFPNTNNTHDALKFTSSGSKTLYVFNPVDFAIVSYKNPTTNTRQAITGSIKNKVLTFTNTLPTNTKLVEGMYVSSNGCAIDGKTQITKVNTNSKGIVSVNVNTKTKCSSPTLPYKFAKAPTQYYYSPGQMTFAGIGLFADGTFRYNSKNYQTVVNGIENQISTALNRGIALVEYEDTTSEGHTTKNWADESKWYPNNQPQNVFSYFMHTAKVNGQHIFSLPKNKVTSAKGDYMAKAYGFAYDENPVGKNIGKQPQVPSEFSGSYPKGTKKLKLILGPWK